LKVLEVDSSTEESLSSQVDWTIKHIQSFPSIVTVAIDFKIASCSKFIDFLKTLPLHSLSKKVPFVSFSTFLYVTPTIPSFTRRMYFDSPNVL
jgi:hypothetical protein